MTAYTEAQKRAIQKYMKNIDTIYYRVPNEKKDRIKAIAAEQGLSVNAFIDRAVDHEIEAVSKDSGQIPEQSGTGQE
jgi:predicted HicB family RNase H-like nuclease